MFLRILFLFVVLTAALFPQKNSVVAEFGNQKIYLDEFRLAYLDIIKKPDVFDSPKLREEYLDELIYEKVLAKEAQKQGYDKSELFQYRLKSFKDKALRESHYNNVIKPKIKFTEDDVEQAYVYTQEERRLSHLFAETKQKADSLYKLLKSGVPFAVLAQSAFADTALANSGGDLGWVTWNQLQYDLAMAAFKLPVDSVSAPVKSQFGYHILKVTGFKKKPLISRFEYEQYRKKTRYLLESKMGEKYALEYISDMMGKAKIKYEVQAMDFVRERLSGIFLREPENESQPGEIQLNEQEVRKMESHLWDERNTLMATINGKKLTIGDFLGFIHNVPYQALRTGFKRTFEYVLRDFLLTNEARRMGLEKQREVKLKANLFKEYYLQMAVRKTAINSITVSEDEVKQQYENNKAVYKGISFEEAKGIARRDVIMDKKQHAVPNYVRTLLNGVEIKKYMAPIHKYYDSIADKTTLK